MSRIGPLSRKSQLSSRGLLAETIFKGLNESSSLGPYASFQSKYWSDPAGFVRDVIAWPPGGGPAPYQLDILSTVMSHRRVTARGPRGLGKTALSAWLVLWFALTRDGRDWKVVTTAGAWRQVIHFLWPEIHKWERRIRWDVVGRKPFTKLEALILNLNLVTGSAFAAVSDNPTLIEGAHADHLLYIFDEAKAIPATTFDSAEGAFSGAGITEAMAFAPSTPGEPQGRFYDMHSRKPGYEDWAVRHVTLAETLAAKRVGPDWVEQRALQWGRESAIFKNHVEGEFAASDADGVIPLAWVEAAIERWWIAQEQRTNLPADRRKLSALGVDVARSGSAKTVLAPRYGTFMDTLRYYSHGDTMVTVGIVDGILLAHGGRAVVDVIGIGAGVVDRLVEMGRDIVPFVASGKSVALDRLGEQGFTNKRSEAWWLFREMLDPDQGNAIALPPDDVMIGDLVAPHYRQMSGGKIQVESKDDIYKRIHRSTDAADAVIMAFYQGPTRRPFQAVATGIRQIVKNYRVR